jgi:hypothetical protein
MWWWSRKCLWRCVSRISALMHVGSASSYQDRSTATRPGGHAARCILLVGQSSFPALCEDGRRQVGLAHQLLAWLMVVGVGAWCVCVA